MTEVVSAHVVHGLSDQKILRAALPAAHANTSCVRGNRTIVSPRGGPRKVRIGKSLCHRLRDSEADTFAAQKVHGA